MIALKLAINNLKRFFQEKNSTLIYIVLPVAILAIIILFLSFDAKISVLVADQAKSPLTESYIEYLKENKQLIVNEITLADHEQEIDGKNQLYTEEYIQSLIKDLRVNTFIKIPQGFDEKFLNQENIRLKAYALNESQAQLVISNLNDSFFTNVKALYIGSGKDINKFNTLLEEFDHKEILVASQYTSENKTPINITFSLGMLIYFILLASVKITKYAVEDKTSRVYHRIFTMPVTAKDYILGYIISTFSIVAIQIILNILAISLLTQGNIPILEIIITLSIFSFCSIAISLLIIAVVNKESTIEILTQGVVMFSSMLAGIFWPLEFMPAFMQRIAVFFPQFWAFDLLEYLFHGGSILNKKQNILMLLGMFLLFFITAIYFMRINDDIKDAS